MPAPAGAGRRAAYTPALLIGVLAALHVLPTATLAGDGGMWAFPAGDLAQNLSGHLALQAPGWHWPLLDAPGLMWPHGLSIAMTDSNPLMTLAAKLLSEIIGHPLNLLGVWLALCWVLQPLAAVYALRGFGARGWDAALAAAALGVLFPAWLARYGHVNLCGHFVILIALGLALRMRLRPDTPPFAAWWPATLLLMVAVLIHPYLFVFAGALLAAPALQALLAHGGAGRRIAAGWLFATILPVAMFALLSGTLGAGGRGFAYYSMNLLSPVWPQRSGLFGAALPVIDATGGQYEGFNYLGAGGLLLIAFAAVALWRRPAADWRARRGFLVVLAALALLALSTKVYAGHRLLLSLGVRPWDQVFGFVQSSGRAFWAVGYALLLGAVAVLAARLPRTWLRAALLLAVALQWLDTTPLRADARAFLAGAGQQPPAISLPPGLGLLTTAPLCGDAGAPAAMASTLRLLAIRAGARVADIPVGRLPVWFNCESQLTDATELPLRPRELRLFLSAPALSRFRLAVLGANTACRAIAGMIACDRALPASRGAAVSPGEPLPLAAVPSGAVDGGRLAPLLSFGWKATPDGAFWSEGPRATLLFRVPPTDHPLVVRLQLDGVAPAAGGTRAVLLRVGDRPAVPVTLPDLSPALVTLPIGVPLDGVLRIAIDIFHPVDPAKRRLSAPVGRAGVRLRALEIAPAG